MNVIFFNHFHNGDVHISRKFVRQIMRKVIKKHPDTTFTFSHFNAPDLLGDIPNLKYDNISVKNVKDSDNLVRIGNDIYINSWYCQQSWKYFKHYGLTIDCLYMAYNDTCKEIWGFDLKSISNDPIDFFPTIDYSKYFINNAQNWIKNHPEEKIMVENGKALSGQANNFPITPIIIELANKYADKTFILTTPEDIKLPNNIVYSHDIIKKNDKDLNEVSFLGSYCKTIIGRASGVFTFNLTKEHLFKKNIKFICFSKIGSLPNKFWLGPLWQNKVKYSSTFVSSTETNLLNIKNIIEHNL